MEAMSRLDGGEFLALVVSMTALLSLAAVLITAIVSPQWRRVRHAEAEIRLKQELVAASYSAEDIDRIVRASSLSALPRRSAEPQYANYRR